MTLFRGKLAVAAAVCGVLAVAGCGSAGGGAEAKATPTATATGSSPARTFGCLSAEQARDGSLDVPAVSGTRPGYYRPADSGPAKVAVVFSHQKGGSLCEFLPYFPAFTKAGYAVLAAEVPGSPATDLPSAVKWLGAKGVTKVVLVGASKGGTGSLVAAAAPSPLPVAAVVSLSGPAKYQGDDADKAVRTSQVPEFFGAEENDSPFARDAEELYAAAVAPAKALKVYPGGNHGAALLADGALPDVLAFLAQHAPAAG
ncbi:alpha/beta hydrolase family protein [Kitasatospora sp. NPDC127111]|uniref:alpha/beta hydrolase family protein n=1 Tax=Kitasatospora sp. NPDC127111 TaxID=3345363 RepID=UPI00363B01F9